MKFIQEHYDLFDSDSGRYLLESKVDHSLNRTTVILKAAKKLDIVVTCPDYYSPPAPTLPATPDIGDASPPMNDILGCPVLPDVM